MPIQAHILLVFGSAKPTPLVALSSSQPRRQDAEAVAFAASGEGSGRRSRRLRGDTAGHIPRSVLPAGSFLPFPLLGESPYPQRRARFEQPQCHIHIDDYLSCFLRFRLLVCVDIPFEVRKGGSF
jgi:hypothetical protein